MAAYKYDINHPKLDYLKSFVSKKDPKEDYKIISNIGSGTYGDVYKATKLDSNILAAVKIIKIDLKDDIKAICQEIHTLRDCRHPNIVRYYGSYFRHNKLWICMEYCGGQSMQDIYTNIRRPLEEDCISYVTRETLRGLQYMHKQGKIHRDIKGANILLTDDGKVKIADFGVAAQITQTINKRNSFIGTPYWMAPEVAAVDRKGGYDEKCDIWATGITAIEYAELQPPMFDLHPMKALHFLSMRNYKPPTLQMKSHWSSRFHSFLKCALTKNEKKRPDAETLLKHEMMLDPRLSEAQVLRLLLLSRNPGSVPIVTSEDDDDDTGTLYPGMSPPKAPSTPPANRPPERIHSLRRPLNEKAESSALEAVFIEAEDVERMEEPRVEMEGEVMEVEIVMEKPLFPASVYLSPTNTPLVCHDKIVQQIEELECCSADESFYTDREIETKENIHQGADYSTLKPIYRDMIAEVLDCPHKSATTQDNNETATEKTAPIETIESEDNLVEDTICEPPDTKTDSNGNSEIKTEDPVELVETSEDDRREIVADESKEEDSEKEKENKPIQDDSKKEETGENLSETVLNNGSCPIKPSAQSVLIEEDCNCIAKIDEIRKVKFAQKFAWLTGSSSPVITAALFPHVNGKSVRQNNLSWNNSLPNESKDLAAPSNNGEVVSPLAAHTNFFYPATSPSSPDPSQPGLLDNNSSPHSSDNSNSLSLSAGSDQSHKDDNPPPDQESSSEREEEQDEPPPRPLSESSAFVPSFDDNAPFADADADSVTTEISSTSTSSQDDVCGLAGEESRRHADREKTPSNDETDSGGDREMTPNRETKESTPVQEIRNRLLNCSQRKIVQPYFSPQTRRNIGERVKLFEERISRYSITSSEEIFRRTSPDYKSSDPTPQFVPDLVPRPTMPSLDSLRKPFGIRKSIVPMASLDDAESESAKSNVNDSEEPLKESAISLHDNILGTPTRKSRQCVRPNSVIVTSGSCAATSLNLVNASGALNECYSSSLPVIGSSEESVSNTAPVSNISSPSTPTSDRPNQLIESSDNLKPRRRPVPPLPVSSSLKSPPVPSRPLSTSAVSVSSQNASQSSNSTSDIASPAPTSPCGSCPLSPLSAQVAHAAQVAHQRVITGIGLPPTPKVHMGACFSLVFEGCPLKINATASWVHPTTKGQIILFGTNDGIYYLSLLDMHEGSLELLFPRRCLWLYVVKDTMISLSGQNPQLYNHNLITMMKLKSQRQTMGAKKLNKFSKLLPKRFLPTIKIPDTKGCQRVNVTRNPFNGSKYLCAALSDQILVMEWFNPIGSFVELKRVEVPNLPSPLLTFELFVVKDQNLPFACLGVYRTSDSQRLKFHLVNLNSDSSKWFDDSGLPNDELQVVKVIQWEHNTIFVCFQDHIKVVSLSGKLKNSRHIQSVIDFSVTIDSIVCLRDSILTFHMHGLKGKNFKGELTQDINDEKHVYRLLGHDRNIVVESRPTDDPMSNSNVYLLAGHTDST